MVTYMSPLGGTCTRASQDGLTYSCSMYTSPTNVHSATSTGVHQATNTSGGRLTSVRCCLQANLRACQTGRQVQQKIHQQWDVYVI